MRNVEERSFSHDTIIFGGYFCISIALNSNRRYRVSSLDSVPVEFDTKKMEYLLS